MKRHNYDLEDKIITSDDYTFNRNPTQTFGLHDKVVCYFDGYDRKVIPLYVSLSYPIIYDKLYSENDDKVRDITIAVCPFTLCAALFEGKFVATSNIENCCLVISNGEDTFSIANSFTYSHKFKHITKSEVDIKILRNVFTEHPDCKYMVLSDKKNINPILDLKYYENNDILFRHVQYPSQIHPKTLVYCIQYVSAKDQSLKCSIVVGKDAKSKEITGYNVIESGVYNYLMTFDDKIKLKLGFVMPIMWFAWKSFFPEAKIIYIP